MTRYERAVLAETSYVRTRGGWAVHRKDCGYANRAERGGRASPWAWAEGKTPDQLDRELRELGIGYRACLHCFPGLPNGAWLGAKP